MDAKIIIVFIVAIIAAVGLFFWGRRRYPDSRRVQRALDAANSAGANVDRARKQNKELTELADDISADNRNTLAANKRSQQILRNAKKRSENN